jgi:hypothetical protein
MNYTVFDTKKQKPVKTNKPLTAKEARELCDQLNGGIFKNRYEIRENK